MKLYIKDIIDHFKIVRDLGIPTIYGPFDMKCMLFNKGGQFMDLNMHNGDRITISLN